MFVFISLFKYCVNCLLYAIIFFIFSSIMFFGNPSSTFTFINALQKLSNVTSFVACFNFSSTISCVSSLLSKNLYKDILSNNFISFMFFVPHSTSISCLNLSFGKYSFSFFIGIYRTAVIEILQA